MEEAENNYLESLRESQREIQMRMTPEERLNFAFRLCDFAIILSKFKKSESNPKDDLPWIELRFKADKGEGFNKSAS